MTDQTPSPQPTPPSKAALRAQKKADDLAAKLEKLKAKIKEVEDAKKAKEALVSKLTKATPWKEKRRQQALIGAAIMNKWESNAALKAQITKLLDGFYTDPKERQVLGLDPAVQPAVDKPEAP